MSASGDGAFVADVHQHGAGPVVILVHGSASDARTWVHQLALAERFTVLTYSRRYHWPNEQPSEEFCYLMGEHVADLVDVIESSGDRPVHLVGHSYGGFVSLLTALRHPALVRSLILIEPPVVPLFLSDPPKPTELLSVLARTPKLGAALIKFGATGLVPATKAAKKNDMENALRLFGTAVLGKRSFTRMSPERRDQAQANNIRAEYLSESFDPVSDDEIRSILTPTLLVSGSDSPSLWAMLADHLFSLLPNSERVEVPNASHIVHEDNPTRFNQHVIEFLGTVD